MSYLVIKNQLLASDRYFLAFDKNRFRQDDFLQWEGKLRVSKQRIFDGEKGILFTPTQGVSINLGCLESVVMPYYRLQVGFTLRGACTCTVATSDVRVGEYINRHGTDVIGRERIGENWCYVVQTTDHLIERRFWIDPEQGYRPRRLETPS